MRWDLLELEDSNEIYNPEGGDNDEHSLEEITPRRQKDPRRTIEIMQENKQLSKELFDFFN